MTSEILKLKTTIDCCTKNVVYVIKRKKCPTQYVWEMQNTHHVRLTGHRSDIHHQRMDRQMARHFCQLDHSTHDLTIMTVEKIHRNNANYRQRKENHRINAPFTDSRWPQYKSTRHIPSIYNQTRNHNWGSYRGGNDLGSPPPPRMFITKMKFHKESMYITFQRLQNSLKYLQNAPNYTSEHLFKKNFLVGGTSPSRDVLKHVPRPL